MDAELASIAIIVLAGLAGIVLAIRFDRREPDAGDQTPVHQPHAGAPISPMEQPTSAKSGNGALAATAPGRSGDPGTLSGPAAIATVHRGSLPLVRGCALAVGPIFPGPQVLITQRLTAKGPAVPVYHCERLFAVLRSVEALCKDKHATAQERAQARIAAKAAWLKGAGFRDSISAARATFSNRPSWAPNTPPSAA